VFLGALKAVAILPSITNNNLTMSNMLGDALREYTGLRHQIDENLIGENGLEWAEQLKRFLRKEPCWVNGSADKPPARFEERDGIIYFTVTSNGKTGAEWMVHFEKTGKRLSDYAKQLLMSPAFKPTNGITTPIQVLKGMLWNDRDRLTKNIRAMAKERKLLDPNPEVACLIRDMFTDEEIAAMGLWWIVAMHEPIKDSDGDPSLLYASRGDGGRWLETAYVEPDDGWLRERGFAFVAPQV
jgi:hypothetical protein